MYDDFTFSSIVKMCLIILKGKKAAKPQVLNIDYMATETFFLMFDCF